MDVFDYSAIGQRIKTLRKSKGLNQQDLANLLGKSLRTVQKYETGEIEVSIAIVNELAKLLDKLGVSVIELEGNFYLVSLINYIYINWFWEKSFLILI